MRLDVEIGQKVTVIDPGWLSSPRKEYSDTITEITYRSIKTTRMTFKRSNGYEWGKSARHGKYIDTRNIRLITNEEAKENA